jgi:hypothetical protein
VKKILLSALLVMFCIYGPASAAETTFEPTPSNLDNLDHSYYYSWGIDWQLPADEILSGATLSFDNINNWAVENNDILYVSLLGSATPGVTYGIDNEASGNAFDGFGTQLFTYSDRNGSAPEDVSFDFNGTQLSLLNGAMADGNFGLGFDPDCHYYNDGVKLKLTTRVVPEPVSSALFLLGGGALALVRRVRRK